MGQQKEELSSNNHSLYNDLKLILINHLSEKPCIKQSWGARAILLWEINNEDDDAAGGGNQRLRYGSNNASTNIARSRLPFG